MDGASGPLLIMLALIMAGFGGVLIFAGGGGNEGYRFAPEGIKGEPTGLTRFDKIVGNTLRTIGLIVVVISCALLFKIVLPAPGYEWLDEPVVWAVPLIFAGNCLARADEPLGTRDLLHRRLSALGLFVVSLATFYLIT